MIDYSPLWATMKSRGVTQYRLLREGIDNKTLDSLKKGENITLLTLEKLCAILQCTPNDVVRFVEDASASGTPRGWLAPVSRGLFSQLQKSSSCFTR